MGMTRARSIACLAMNKRLFIIVFLLKGCALL